MALRKDGSIRWRGGFVEVAAEVRGKVELRYDPADLSKLSV